MITYTRPMSAYRVHELRLAARLRRASRVVRRQMYGYLRQSVIVAQRLASAVLYGPLTCRLVAAYSRHELTALRAQRASTTRVIIDAELYLSRMRTHLASLDAAIALTERDITVTEMRAK